MAKPRRAILIAPLYLFAAAMLWCAHATGKTPAKVGVADLRIGNKLSGWKEDARAFVAFGPDKLFELINGAAPEYIDQGLVEGIFLRISGGKSLVAEMFVEDFGTAGKARGMLRKKAAEPDVPEESEKADESRIHISSFIGGFTAYSSIDRFYIELVLTGTNDKDVARKKIDEIIGWYRGRITPASVKKPVPDRN